VDDTIIVAGSLAQKPRRGGHSWVYLQYLLGFQRLGWDVLFLDAVADGMCVDDAGSPCPADRSANLAYLKAVMEQAGLGDKWALLAPGECFGLNRKQIEERVKRSAFILNVNGYVRDAEILGAAPRRVFLDIDPGILQMWQALGLHDVFSGHDDYVTIAGRIGAQDCPIPLCGITWITTPPPVVLDEWPVCQTDGRKVFTSVAAWRGAFGPVEYDGRTYGPRVHQFRRFIDVPGQTGAAFELALDIHPAETRDLSALAAHGWSLTDPLTAAADPAIYKRYVQQSGAEFMVAKGVYVDTRCGWISDRTVCYLASGKPVVAQDTGIREMYQTGDGLLTFTTLDEAVAAVRDVENRYDHHARAARVTAERYFDSDVVLTSLLASLGVPSLGLR
jgi:hypothetical protein